MLQGCSFSGAHVIRRINPSAEIRFAQFNAHKFGASHKPPVGFALPVDMQIITNHVQSMREQ